MSFQQNNLNCNRRGGTLKKILVIDDESFIHFLYKNILGDSYEVESVTDPFEAVKKVKKEEYDSIIVDINMPYINGLEIVETARKKDMLKDTLHQNRILNIMLKITMN